MREAVDEMVRRLIALVDQGIFAVDHGDFGVVVIERRDIRIVLPQMIAGRAHVGQEAAGVTFVQVPHGGREHDDIAGRQEVFEQEFLHGRISRPPAAMPGRTWAMCDIGPVRL